MPYTEHRSMRLKEMIYIDRDIKTIYLQEAHRQKKPHTANRAKDLWLWGQKG